MKLEQLLWDKTASYEKEHDPQGIFQRFLEALGFVADNGMTNALEGYIQNVTDPITALPEQLRYMLDSYGLKGVSHLLQGSRYLVAYLPLIMSCKANIRFLKYAYSYYDITIDQVQYNEATARYDYGSLFDIGVPLDTSGINRSRTCELFLIGPPATSELLATVLDLARYNLSPYVTYIEIYYNGEPILTDIISAVISGITIPEGVGLPAGTLQISYPDTEVSFEVIDGILYITVPANSNLDLNLFEVVDGKLVYGN